MAIVYENKKKTRKYPNDFEMKDRTKTTNKQKYCNFDMAHGFHLC